ncbi:MAG: hypothetical protein IKZ90_11645 [Clostridiales bacterium]|nr:hypothetical protein [Clostridiales bacterium]
MKRPIILALTLVLSGTVLFACGRKDPSSGNVIAYGRLDGNYRHQD